MEIKRIRNEIDEIDLRIVKLLEERTEKILQIGALKSSLQIPIKDANREATVLDAVRKHTTLKGVRNHIERIFRTILQESKSIQTKLSGEETR